MSDRPILFSAPMVRALLAGNKTQTRRTLKEQHHDLLPARVAVVPGGAATYEWRTRYGNHAGYVAGLAGAGDRLWVREAHALLPRTAYRGSVGTGTIEQVEHPTDGYTAAVFREGFDRSGRPPWQPSTRMPRWASRLTLIVTGVRVQRLQDISEEDCIAEGPTEVNNDPRTISGELQPMVVLSPGRMMTPRAWYHTLWDQINGPGAWEKNPWVAAYTFTVHRKNIDQMEAEHAG